MTRKTRIALIAAYPLAHLLVIRLGGAFKFGSGHHGQNAIWPASGLLLAALLLTRRRDWPWLVLGMALAHEAANRLGHGHALLHSQGMAVANAVAAIAGALILRTAFGARFKLDRLREVIGLVLAGLAATLLSASLGAVMKGTAHEVPYSKAWQVWWFGDALGMILVTPVIVTVAAAWGRPAWPAGAWRRIEAVALFVTTAVVAQLIFGSEPGPARSVFGFQTVLVPFLAWGALRFRPRAVSVAVLMVALMALYHTSRDRGVLISGVGSTHELVLAIQSWLAVVSIGILLLSATVTEHNNAEAGLRESEARYRTLVEHAPEAIVVLDVETGRFIDANDNAEQLYGLTREALLEVGPADMSPAIQPGGRPSGEYAMEVIGKALAGETPVFEWMHIDGAGKEIPCEVALVRLPASDRDLVRGSVLDITARKAAEEAAEQQRQQLIEAEKMISLGTLVSGVAHEVNNPNHAMMLHMLILRQVWEDVAPILDEHVADTAKLRLANIPYEEMREDVLTMIDEVIEGTERIRYIISELRDYARGEPPTAAERVRINDAVRSALILLDNPIRKASSEFSVEYGQELPDVRGSIRRLEQVVINLILNACQALSGPSQAVVVATRTTHDRGTVEVIVRDAGRGIATDDLSRIRDPFFTTKRDTGGTGLGLAVAARIVEEHGGTLAFDSTPGGGTTATLSLPSYPETGD